MVDVKVKDLEVEGTKEAVEKETGVKLTDREAYDLNKGLKPNDENKT